MCYFQCNLCLWQGGHQLLTGLLAGLEVNVGYVTECDKMRPAAALTTGLCGLLQHKATGGTLAAGLVASPAAGPDGMF